MATNKLFHELITGSRALSGGLLQLIYPRLCWTCGQSLGDDNNAFCRDCIGALIDDPHETCPQCGATVGPYADIGRGCSNCRNESFGFDGVVRLGLYKDLRKEVILRLKEAQNEGLAEHLGQLLAEKLRDKLQAVAPDVVIPIPLHWWRQIQRGYNQSQVLAQALARELHLPCQSLWLRRVRATPKQALLARTTRLENLRGAFRTPRPAEVRGKSVLLVDDVLTTGTTVSEASKALHRAGAKRVVVVVIATAA